MLAGSARRLASYPSQISAILERDTPAENKVLFCSRFPFQNSEMICAYARVSGPSQNLDTQVDQLQAAGAAKVFKETASGARPDRIQLARAIRQLGAGDVLLVTRLDRLARSTRDLLNVLAQVTERGAGFRSLSDVWADTTTPHGRLMLTVLGGLAEFERELIRARTGDGRESAKAAGIRFGRKPILTTHQQREAARRRDSGNETLREIGRSYNVSAQTISRLRTLS